LQGVEDEPPLPLPLPLLLLEQAGTASENTRAADAARRMGSAPSKTRAAN
jgi:hypothetical protein